MGISSRPVHRADEPDAPPHHQYPPGRSTVWHRFLQCAAAVPERIAVEWGRHRLSYGELAAIVDEIGHRLTAAVPLRSVLAIHGPASPAYLGGLFAVMRSGGIALPIDDRLPVARKRQILDTCGAALVLDCCPVDTGAFAGYPAVRLDPTSGTLAGGVPTVPVAAGKMSEYADPAYIFTTSGTTGQPKAVLGRAASLDHFVAWQRRQFGIGAGDRVLQVTNLSFDPSLREMFVALTSGATLVIPRGAAQSEPHGIPELIAAAGITLIHTVPTLARFWLRLAERGFPDLRATFFAGEPLTADLLTAWRRTAPAAEVVNLYGPTETTLARFFWRVPAGGDVTDADPLPVGTAIPDTRAVLVDSENRVLAPGGRGEILIDTAFPSYGYPWNVEEQERRFVEIPGVTPQYGTRFYRTGDLGMVDAAGRLVVLGRVDNQIKIAGVRFEPREVEEALCAHPAIDRAVVRAVAAGAAGHGKYLVAWYVGDDLSPPPAAEIRRFLNKRLMRAMIPSAFFPVPEIPRSLNGKIDMAALRDLVAANRPSSAGPTPTEQWLAEIWRRVLRGDVDGPWADFFALGGDSLGALEVTLAIERDRRVHVGIDDLFEHPTIGELASFIDGMAAARERYPPPSVAGEPDVGPERSSVDPLSPQQQAYRVACMPDGDYNWCILSRVIALPATVVESDLRRALAVLVRRYDALRLRFPRIFQEATQEFVAPALCRAEDVPIESHVLTAADRRAADAAIAAIRARGSQVLFDLSRWPVFRAALIRQPARSTVILWIHHLTVDGLSLNRIALDLVAELERPAGESGTGVCGAVPGYRDYLSWLRRTDDDAVEAAAAARRYWRTLLDRYRPLSLPEAPGRDSGRGHHFTHAFPEALVDAVLDLAKRHGCTPFAVLLGAYMTALSRMIGRDDILINIPNQHRPHAAFRDSVGLFVSQSLVRFDIGRLLANRHWPKAIMSQVLDGQRHTAAHEFHLRLADADLSGASSYYPFTTALFNQNHLGPDSASLAELVHGEQDLGRDLRFQIQGEIQVAGNRFAMRYLYRRGAFPSTAAIATFADAVAASASRLCGL